MSIASFVAAPVALPERIFGKTGEKIPILGLGTAPGGFGLNDFDAVDVIHAAIDNGVTYLDTAPGYERAQIQLGEVLPSRRDEVFLVSKTFTSRADKAVEILEQSLRDMKTDCVDVTFVHSVGSLDPDEILASDGALAGLRSAQVRGLTKYIGFTAHHCPGKAERMLREAEFDAVMFAMNFADKHTYDFQGGPLSLAKEGNLGVAAMKVYGGAPEQKYEVPTPSLMAETQQNHEAALHYALTLPGVSTAVVGMYTEREVVENVAYAKSFSPVVDESMLAIESAGEALATSWKAHFGPVQ
jgi:predicted aldo/keto reductase-like oxidoreductase